MHQIPLLHEIATIAAVGALVAVLLARVRLPAVAGLLLAGAIVGPHAAGLVHSVDTIEVLAEVGVVLLLFTIGLEFSLNRLRHILGRVSLAGLAQVILTIVAAIVGALALGRPLREGIFWGFTFALSSTAIVLRALDERRETDAPHGRLLVGTLIIQDLVVVPMVVIVPLLGTDAAQGSPTLALAVAAAKAVALVLFTFFVLRPVVPKILEKVAAAQSRDIFLLSVVAFCVGTALVTSMAGLSMALGAFLAGIVLADSDYGHRAMSDMLPLRDAFVSVFFVSLGMLFDVQVLLEHPIGVAAILLLLLLGKGLVASVSALIMRFPPRAAWLAGVGLAQFGEFSFVLAQLGREHAVVPPEHLDVVLAGGILSMFVTPVLLRVAPHITAGERMLSPLARMLGTPGIEEAHAATHHVKDHVIVVGYDTAGSIVTGALVAAEIPVVVLDLDPDAVRRARASGVPIFYADASSVEALGHANLEHARALVVLPHDPHIATRIVDAAHRVAPQTPVILRTRFLRERDPLKDLGASEVVIDELEAGLEVLARVMRRVEIPRNLVEDHVRDIRTQTQQSARKFTMQLKAVGESTELEDMRFESVALLSTSAAVGKTVRAMNVRARTDALIVAVRRQGRLVSNVDPDMELVAGDRVYLVGESRAVRAATALLLRGDTRTQSITAALPVIAR